MKPWHQVVTPRSDVRDGRPLDISEFAIHLHQVVAQTAPDDYRDPARFFARTYITRGLSEMATEVLRRLHGELVQAAPVVNLTTPFGGGKTHALTLLYHLANAGPESMDWPGVAELCAEAGLPTIPKAAVATFVGSQFDAVIGQGALGEPKRYTPWGELAWQLGGAAGFAAVAEQDRLRVRPGGEVLRSILPADRPVLILMDEVLNYCTAARAIRAGDAEGGASTLGAQFLAFLHSLTEEASGRTGLVLVLALPKSEQEMTADDAADFARLQKLTARVDRPYVLTQGLETAEIIRRRLFEDLGPEEERRATARAYTKTLAADRDLLPGWFVTDQAEEQFLAVYPFHPSLLSVFERKWQTVPGFQRTRGVLRMLAVWVAARYVAAFREGLRDPLLSLGTAPLGDPYVRAIVLEQLRDDALEAPILTDIAGPSAHAVALDRAATSAVRAVQLHQAVATAVFFESSGGQVDQTASLPELRLALDAPDLELGHIETALGALVDQCYYLTADGTRYHFSLRPNLNKLLADIRAGLEAEHVEGSIRDAVQAVFRTGGILDRRYFPERSADLPNTPSLHLAVLAPGQNLSNGVRERTLERIASWLREAGQSARIYKSSLFFAVPDAPARLEDAARRLLAWDRLEQQAPALRLEDAQVRQVSDQKARAARDLREAVWQTYRTVVFLGPDGELAQLDLGLLHSSAAETLCGYIESRLRQQDILVSDVSSDFVVRQWPPALPTWPLREMRDAFFSSPRLPRLEDPACLRSTVARGVAGGQFGLAYMDQAGQIARVRFREPVSETDVEFLGDLVLLPQATAEAFQSGEASSATFTQPLPAALPAPSGAAERAPESGRVTPTATIRSLRWTGELPPSKWALFYTKVLSKLVPSGGLQIRVDVLAEPGTGLTDTQGQDISDAIRELDLGTPELTADPDPEGSVMDLPQSSEDSLPTE